MAGVGGRGAPRHLSWGRGYLQGPAQAGHVPPPPLPFPLILPLLPRAGGSPQARPLSRCDSLSWLPLLPQVSPYLGPSESLLPSGPQLKVTSSRFQPCLLHRALLLTWKLEGKGFVFVVVKESGSYLESPTFHTGKKSRVKVGGERMIGFRQKTRVLSPGSGLNSYKLGPITFSFWASVSSPGKGVAGPDAF